MEFFHFSFLAKSHCIDELLFFRINGNFTFQIKQEVEELKEILTKINFEYKQQKEN